MRFYDIEGYEIDVQDPMLHFCEKYLTTTKDTIEQYLSDYLYGK